MAYGKQNKRDEIPFLGYVDVRLDKEQRELFKQWLSKASAPDALIDRYCENGYRVSFSWDKMNKTNQCSLTCTEPTDMNAGYVLVGRGQDSIAAFMQVAYKDEAICQNNWKAFTSKRETDW